MSRKRPDGFMYKRLAIPLLIALCGGYFGYLSLVELWRQSLLSESYPGVIKGLEIVENEDQLFLPKVTYTFFRQGQEVESSEILQNERYKNPWKVEDRLEELVKSDIIIWCNPHQPTVCTLQKTFPYKNMIYSWILLSISFYFYFLGQAADRRADIRK